MTDLAAPSLFDRLIAGWRGYVLIALIALAGALPGVARLPVLDRDEARFAQATRQMLETGDFVRIRVQDTARNKKPIGIHWLQAGAAAATEPFSHSLNAIWAYRIPSTLGAILAALAAFWAGTALMQRRAAFLGAALFAGCTLLGAEGMIAKTDGALCGFTTLAMAALARLYARKDDQSAAHQALIFWIAFGIGSLIKGPVTPMVAGLTLIAIGLWEGRWAWLKPLRRPLGPILCVLIVAPWMIAIGIETQGRFFVDAVGGDLAPKLAGGQEGHFAWPGTHLALLSFLIFPATFALPGALRLAGRVVKAPRADADPLRFLLAWIVPTFLVFELLPTKLMHYTLPVYPAIALLGGAALVAAFKERQRWTNALGLALFALAGAVMVALIAYGVTLAPGGHAENLRRAAPALAIGGGAFLIALLLMIFVRHPVFRAGAALIIALSASWILRDRVLPEARTVLVSAELTSALQSAHLEPNAQRALWVYGYRETSLVFMTRTDIHLTPDMDVSHVKAGDTLVIERALLPFAHDALQARGLAFLPRAADVRGVNYGNGDKVDLAIGAAERAP